MCCVGLPSIVRLASPQRCSPARNGRFARPCGRSAYTYTPSDRSPARLASFSQVPPRWRRRSKPRSAPSGAGSRRRKLVAPFGEKLVSSRALHPPFASRCFDGGIPPPRLVRVWCSITRTGASPFPCVCSSHASPWPDLPLRRVFLRSFCARRCSIDSLNSWGPHETVVKGLFARCCRLLRRICSAVTRLWR